MPQSLVQSPHHIVFATKYRQPLIEKEWKERMYSYIGGVIRKRKCVLLCAGGIEDHVHLLVSQHPTVCLSDLLRDIKAESSAWVHETMNQPEFQWQRGYGAFAVSFSHIDPMKRYIENQEAHHAKVSYRAEYTRLVKKNGLVGDDRYMWD